MNVIHVQFFDGWDGTVEIEILVNGGCLYQGAPTAGQEAPPHDVGTDAVEWAARRGGRPVAVVPDRFPIAREHWIRLSWRGAEITLREQAGPFVWNDTPPVPGGKDL